MPIIGVSGYAKSGKDTVGKIVQHLTSDIKYPDHLSIGDILKNIPDHSSPNNPWQIKKWAGKLKEVASLLSGIPIRMFEDQEFKQGPMPKCWSKWKYNGKVGGTDVLPVYGNDPELVPMTAREFLQRLGTEALRNQLHENTWVNALMADYHSSAMDINHKGVPKWVITDTRFPNEAVAIKENGGVIIRVNRPGITAVNNHPSETSLDDWKFDYVIENNKNIDYLIDQVKNIMTQEKLFTNAKDSVHS